MQLHVAKLVTSAWSVRDTILLVKILIIYIIWAKWVDTNPTV